MHRFTQREKEPSIKTEQVSSIFVCQQDSKYIICKITGMAIVVQF